MWYGNVALDSFRIESVDAAYAVVVAAAGVGAGVDAGAGAGAATVGDGSDAGVDDVHVRLVCWSVPMVPLDPVRQFRRIGRPPSAEWPQQSYPDSFSTSSGVE